MLQNLLTYGTITAWFNAGQMGNLRVAVHQHIKTNDKQNKKTGDLLLSTFIKCAKNTNWNHETLANELRHLIITRLIVER